MAVGDFLFDGGSPPPILRKALNYERWGMGDVMNLPAGLLPQINAALNVHNAIKSYQSARKSTTWASDNPDAWNLVSYIISERMERNRGNRNQ